MWTGDKSINHRARGGVEGWDVCRRTGARKGVAVGGWMVGVWTLKTVGVEWWVGLVVMVMVVVVVVVVAIVVVAIVVAAAVIMAAVMIVVIIVVRRYHGRYMQPRYIHQSDLSTHMHQRQRLVSS